MLGSLRPACGFCLLGIIHIIHAGFATFSDARVCGVNDPPTAPLDRPGYARGATTGGTTATTSTMSTGQQPGVGGAGYGTGYGTQPALGAPPTTVGAIAPAQGAMMAPSQGAMAAAPLQKPLVPAPVAAPLPASGVPLGAVAGSQGGGGQLAGSQMAGQATGQPSGGAMLGGAAGGAAAGIGAAGLGKQVWTGPPQQVATGQPLVAGSSGTQGLASSSLTSLEAARAVSPV